MSDLPTHRSPHAIHRMHNTLIDEQDRPGLRYGVGCRQANAEHAARLAGHIARVQAIEAATRAEWLAAQDDRSEAERERAKRVYQRRKANEAAARRAGP